MLCGMDKLPPDLRQYVKDDNELFEKEMKEWDVLQALKAQPENPLAEATAATSASAACSTVTSPASAQPASIHPESQGQAGRGAAARPPVDFIDRGQVCRDKSSRLCVAAPNQDPDYMDQLSPQNYSNHLQQDTERAIARAAAEQEEEETPEALLNAVRIPQVLAYAPGTPDTPGTTTMVPSKQPG